MDDLHRRLKAARSYLGANQTDFGVLLGGMTKEYVIKVESERGLSAMPPFQRRTLIAGYSDATGIPQTWFTADWSQLDPGYEPPEKASELIGEVLAALKETATVGAGHLETLDKRLTRIERVLKLRPSARPPSDSEDG